MQETTFLGLNCCRVSAGFDSALQSARTADQEDNLADTTCCELLPPAQRAYSASLLNGLGHDEATDAGGREFDPRPGHYSRTSF